MNNYLPTDYQAFIHTSRYARWLEDENRRETWPETVSRYMSNVILPKLGKSHPEIKKIEDMILNLDVMPSMRALMTAGPAANRDNTCMYNCSYLPVDDPKAFDEAMYILLCGTGVGFSVESDFVNKLPEIPELQESDLVIKVKDSKEGWAKALRQVVALLYAGEIPQWDVSLVRPAGARLKTFGGRASGPAPLVDLFNFTLSTFKSAQGRKLAPIECHDLMCKIGEIVVVGGVRRSAMISLSNLDDDRMRHAKSGSWYDSTPYRALSNNSVCYTEKPAMETFMREWLALVESKSGERGVFNRQACKDVAKRNGRRNPEFEFGTNPCSEISLRPHEFCNQSEVVVRATDDINSLVEKVKIATIIGTIQSSYTKFPYLRKVWANNCEEERLLGVSLTGIMDNPLMTKANSGLDKTLDTLRQVSIDTNKEWSSILGIQQSTATTCVKPSGTVSQMVDSASGIHARHSPYYIRTVRGDNKDPLTKFMVEQGIPSEPCAMKPDNTTVFSFPVKSPDNSIFRDDMTAIEQLELWLTYQRHWCEHKPSITVSVKEEEWLEVGSFVYKHFDEMSGVSFLPYVDHSYVQAPYQEVEAEGPLKVVVSEFDDSITERHHTYESLLSIMPSKIDWSKLSDFEVEDTTRSSQTFACTGEVCEMVDISS